MSKSMTSNVYFLNCIREVLGMCPLPGSHEAAVENASWQRHGGSPLEWTSGETDGCRRTPKVGSHV